MTQIISRMYASPHKAKLAYDELKAKGYQTLYLFDPPKSADGQGAGLSRAETIEAMAKAYILKSHAALYADKLANAGGLVTVHAPFGTAKRATAMLHDHEPIDTGVPEPQLPSYAWDPDTPFSSAFQLPVLSATARPFEKFSGVPSLLRKVKYLSLFPLLTNDWTPLSSAFGLPTLTSSPTPFSSLFGLPLLTSPGRKTRRK
jgi:hypothetical protein